MKDNEPRKTSKAIANLCLSAPLVHLNALAKITHALIEKNFTNKSSSVGMPHEKKSCAVDLQANGNSVFKPTVTFSL